MAPITPTDSLDVTTTFPVAGDTLVVRPRRKTVSDVIGSLPPDATPSEQDDAVQAAFPKAPMTWPDDAQLGIPGIQVDTFDAEVPALGSNDTPYTRNSPWRYEQLDYRPEGIAGDPLPYRLRTDDYVTAALLLSFFLEVWVVARSYRFLVQQVKDLFYIRRRENLFTPDAELRGQFFLIFQVCFVLGVLFFDYTQEFMTSVFNQVSPYKLLATNVAIIIVYYAVKLMGYAIVDWVFFDRTQHALWMDTYYLGQLALGMALFPVALLVVYFDLSFRLLTIAAAVIAGGIALLLFYRCYAIFFTYRWGFLHLFLYFCTLEILPLLVVWRALVYANNYWVTYF